jgi:prepilin-type N-terminal cleavage/methylation domain-containing protein
MRAKGRMEDWMYGRMGSNQSSSLPSFQSSTAFTLIELLVVVAIIAILAALLLPSLQGARDTAKTAYCANNLRHLSVAAYLYADDHNGFFPDACPLGEIPYGSWMVPISQYLKAPRAPVSLVGTPASGRRGAAYGHPLLCPATSGNPYEWDPYSGSTGWNGYATDYALNDAVADRSRAPVWWIVGRPVHGIPHPSITALFADIETNDGWLGFTAYYRISPRHRNRTRANVICVDGHVESLKVPWPTHYLYYNRSTSELGNLHPSTLVTGSPWDGDGYKVYMYPPGLKYP